MTARALIKPTELKRIAILAKQEGVRVEIQIGNVTIRVSPDRPTEPVDRGGNSELDRELAEFEAKNGYR